MHGNILAEKGELMEERGSRTVQVGRPGGRGFNRAAKRLGWTGGRSFWTTHLVKGCLSSGHLEHSAPQTPDISGGTVAPGPSSDHLRSHKLGSALHIGHLLAETLDAFGCTKVGDLDCSTVHVDQDVIRFYISAEGKWLEYWSLITSQVTQITRSD